MTSTATPRRHRTLKALAATSVGLASALTFSTHTASAVPAGPFPSSSAMYLEKSGFLYVVNPGASQPVKINPTQKTALNGIAFNTVDNYIYGVANTTVYRVDSAGETTAVGTAGSFSKLDTVTADFLPNTSFLLTMRNTFNLADVSSPSYASTSLGLTTGSARTFSPNDVAVSIQGANYVGYGIAGNTLSKVVIPTAAIPADSSTWGASLTNALTITTKSITTSTPVGYTAATGTDRYAAAWTDTTGNMFFYNMANQNVYLATPTELAKATPALTWVANWASAGLSGSFDGASNPSADPTLGPPSRPDVPVLSVGDKTLTVTWAPPASDGGSALTTYKIMLWGKVFEFEPGTTTWTFTNAVDNGAITNGSWYRPVVAASNAIGQSLYSFTPALAFPGFLPLPPASVSATSPSSGTATVVWPFGTASSGNGGWAITNYRVQVSLNNTVVQTLNTNSRYIRTVTVTGLTPGQSYVFTVTPQSDNGWALTSTSSAATLIS